MAGYSDVLSLGCGGAHFLANVEEPSPVRTLLQRTCGDNTEWWSDVVAIATRLEKAYSITGTYAEVAQDIVKRATSRTNAIGAQPHTDRIVSLLSSWRPRSGPLQLFHSCLSERMLSPALSKSKTRSVVEIRYSLCCISSPVYRSRLAHGRASSRRGPDSVVKTVVSFQQDSAMMLETVPSGRVVSYSLHASRCAETPCYTTSLSVQYHSPLVSLPRSSLVLLSRSVRSQNCRFKLTPVALPDHGFIPPPALNYQASASLP